jgi:hypothetical protein
MKEIVLEQLIVDSFNLHVKFYLKEFILLK